MQADKNRLDLLLHEDFDPRTGKPRAGFETVAQCQGEDRSRALALREIARTLAPGGDRRTSAQVIAEIRRLNLDPLAALNLADRLEAGADSAPGAEGWHSYRTAKTPARPGQCP
jgi:hypothetical protein